MAAAIQTSEQGELSALAAPKAKAASSKAAPKSVCRGKLNDCRVFDSLYFAWVSASSAAKKDLPITASRRFIFNSKTGAVAAFQKGWSTPSRHASKSRKANKSAAKSVKFSKKAKKAAAAGATGAKKSKKKGGKKGKKKSSAQKSYEAIAKTFKAIVKTVKNADKNAWNREKSYALFSQNYFVDVHDSRSSANSAARDRFVGISVSRRNFIVAERLFNNPNKWLIATAQGDGVSDLQGFLQLFEQANSKSAKKVRKAKKAKKAKGPGAGGATGTAKSAKKKSAKSAKKKL